MTVAPIKKDGARVSVGFRPANRPHRQYRGSQVYGQIVICTLLWRQQTIRQAHHAAKIEIFILNLHINKACNTNMNML